MYKVMGIIKRPEGMDFEAFKSWWLKDHAPKVKQWPGLKEYRINLCTTPDQAFDGVAEVWFESREAMERARQPITRNPSRFCVHFPAAASYRLNEATGAEACDYN